MRKKAGATYIPSQSFQQPPPKTVKQFQDELTRHRVRILNMAFDIYTENRDAIEKLPGYARDGIRVAVGSYVEIGRVMREKLARDERLKMAGGGKSGKAIVPESGDFG
jgi:hypothetical protein